MLSGLLSMFGSLELKDLLDISVQAFLLYQALRLIRGTRAWQMTLGALSIVLFYYTTRIMDLRAARVFLETSLPYLIFGLVVVFQSEIRRALAEIGKGRILRVFRDSSYEIRFDEIILASTALANQRIGGLIVLERDIGLKNYIESGTQIDAHLSYHLLMAIFNPKGPLHDGAIIITGERIAGAGCLLPMNSDPYLSKELGTRHRAGIGITAETDAISIIISEETGRISASKGGEISLNLDGRRLRRFLQAAFDDKKEERLIRTST